MYQLFFDKYPLYDPRDESLIIRQPDVHLAVGEAGEMSFIIDNDHPYSGALTRMKGVVKLLDSGRTIFRGRIRKDTRAFNLDREIEVEGLLACLNDSIIPPFTFPDDFLDDAAYQAAADNGNIIAFFLEWVLAEHNRQVGSDQQIQLGNVTVTDPNNYIRRASTDYLTAMDVVKKKLKDLLGGHLLADYSGAATVLHYYDELPLTNVQDVEFGENLLDLISELDDAEIFTAILPIGADGLTIESMADGEISPGIWKSGRIIYSVETEKMIGGRITHFEKWDDVTVAENLQSKAAAALTKDGIMTTQTIKVRAVDLGGGFEHAGSHDPECSGVCDIAVAGKSVVGTELQMQGVPVSTGMPRFTVGRLIRLKSAPHGFSATFPLMELEPNILDPAETEITLGSSVKTSTDISHSNQAALEEELNKYRLELNKQQQDITELPQVVQTQITSAIQTSQDIIFEALKQYVETSNFEEYQKTVSGQLSILAEQITMKFTESTEYAKEVDGDLQKTVETLSKYFEFSIDGLAIKAGENVMSLKLDNDVISFRKNGQQFGWWDGVDFHTGNIVIDITERAQFGNFAFVPRSNGSLSFLKVGG